MNIININYTALLSQCFPFWEKISDDEKALLSRSTKLSKFSKGENIHSGNTNCTGVIILKTGCLRVYLLSDEGKEITLYRLYPNDVCVLSAFCVLKVITFDIFIDAEETSEAFIVSGKAFSDVAKQNIYAENYALTTALSRFSDVMWVMQQIIFMSFDKRLAVFLDNEAEKTQSDFVKLTHEQVAKYIGSAREVVSRMLKYFVTENIVSLSRGGIKIIDREKLRSLAK